MIFDKSCLTNDDSKAAVTAYSAPFIFRVVPILRDDNQYLQFALSVFYKDLDESSVANILWNLVNWSKNTVIRCNDNGFFFNRMLGYNTAFFDYVTKDWYWGDVNPVAATCYIKFGDNHFEYLQPLRPYNGVICPIKDNEIIIERT